MVNSCQIIYKAAAEMAAIDPSQCVAIGDSLHHDIKGANAAGISSAFITGGIHATELGLDTFGEIADESSVVALALRHDAYPSYVLPSFNWLSDGELSFFIQENNVSVSKCILIL